MNRLSWDEYFCNMVTTVASRSPCLKRRVGAVVINPDTKNILSTGYNGPVRGAPHCDKCKRENSAPGWDYDQCPAIHAEVNAIISAARNGVCIDGSIIYLTTMPCYHCSKYIINAGICCVVLPDMKSVNPTVVNYLERNKVLVRFVTTIK